MTGPDICDQFLLKLCDFLSKLGAILKDKMCLWNTMAIPVGVAESSYKVVNLDVIQVLLYLVLIKS